MLIRLVAVIRFYNVLYWLGQITKPAAIMRLLYYPPQIGIVDDRTIGIGSHTEYVN